MEISEEELRKQLVDAGNKLLSSPSSVSDLLESLQLVESLLSVVEQSASTSIREALASTTKALIAEELLRHSDDDVKVAVASCISELTRITAPEAPYADDELKEVFQLIVSCLEKLDDKSSRSYLKRISILETLAVVRSFVMMLDLECDDLIVEMFRHFLKTIRDDHHDGVFSKMETIMTLVFEESEAISVDLLSSILNVLNKVNKEVLPIARLLGEKVIVNCASKVKPYLLSAVRSSGASLDDYSKAVADICQAGDDAAKRNPGEDTAIDTIVAANNEKSLKEPILSPIASDNAHVDRSPTSPTGCFADETLSEQLGLGKKKEHPIQENESVSDVDSKSQQDSEGATGLESTLNKHASKKPSSASDKEEREADSGNNTKKKGANINELDGNSAKEVVQEAEVGGSQRVNKKKQGQTKATPAKGHSKTPAKGDKKKTVLIPKATPKPTKDGSGKSSSKRKYPSEENARQINVKNQELVGAKIEVWWPEDKKFYKGVVKSFNAAEKEHKIVYDDGDVELLKLKNEKWKFVGEHEGHGSDSESPDESADAMPIGKKVKTSADLGAKQGKTLSSTKMSGASSSKSKSALKSGKAKEEAPKKIGKSVSKASKSGSKRKRSMKV